MSKEKRTLLGKLHLEHDLSVNRELPEGGRIRRAMGLFSGRDEYNRGRLKNLIAVNILTLLFLAPAIVIMAYLLPVLEKIAIEGLNFSGNLGVGYAPDAVDDVLKGTLAVLDVRLQVLAYLVPCFTLFGVGLAGAFYCMRNYSWGIKVNILTHFLRGVKKFGLTFALALSVLGGLGFLIGFSVLEIIINQLNGASSPGMYALVVFACIFTAFYLIYLMFFLPHVVSYKVKWRYHFKNALIFSVSLFPLAAINLAFFSLPFLLLLMPTLGAYLFYGIGAFLLLGIIALWFTSVGQYAFDNFIEKAVVAQAAQQMKAASAGKGKVKTVKPQKPHVSYKRKKK